jgi:hypothetical protein
VGSYHLLARTDRDDVELFVELNVVPAREENENENETQSAWFGAPPASFLRKPPMVSARSKRPDEICVAWGRVPWPDERGGFGGASGKTEYRVDVPLRGGDCDLNAVGSRSAGSAHTDDPEEGIALALFGPGEEELENVLRQVHEKGQAPRLRTQRLGAGLFPACEPCVFFEKAASRVALRVALRAPAGDLF